jgi:hypothetical protein
MSDPYLRMVGESYKDYADRMYGYMRAAQIDRDQALAALDSLRVEMEEVRFDRYQEGYEAGFTAAQIEAEAAP